MNTVSCKVVANRDLPHLISLVLARKQARWQWRASADEHKHVWTSVINHLDANISICERRIQDRLDIRSFRAKREIVE